MILTYVALLFLEVYCPRIKRTILSIPRDNALKAGGSLYCRTLKRVIMTPYVFNTFTISRPGLVSTSDSHAAHGNQIRQPIIYLLSPAPPPALNCREIQHLPAGDHQASTPLPVEVFVNPLADAF